MIHRILTLAGGGAKGRAQAEWIYLNEIQTRSKTSDYYDLIVGSSVGAINGAFMASGLISAHKLREEFNNVAIEMFHKKPWWKFPKIPIYEKERFIQAWDRIIGVDFKMGDCKTKLVIPAMNMVKDVYGNEKTIFFKSWDPKDANRRLVDVVTYSFSAPVYFGYTPNPQDQRVYGDGGSANQNLPLIESMIEADVLWRNTKDKVLIDAVGCLYSVNEELTSYDNVANLNSREEFMSYIRPDQGGLARAISISDQIGQATYECTRKINYGFRYWDYKIPVKMNKIDAIQYLDDYANFGSLMHKTPLKMVNC